MIRSPCPDVENSDVSLTDFVLACAGELDDKPALIDAPSGRTITYAQLVDSVRAVAADLAEWGFGKGEVFAHYTPNLPECAVSTSSRRFCASPRLWSFLSELLSRFGGSARG